MPLEGTSSVLDSDFKSAVNTKQDQCRSHAISESSPMVECSGRHQDETYQADCFTYTKGGPITLVNCVPTLPSQGGKSAGPWVHGQTQRPFFPLTFTYPRIRSVLICKRPAWAYTHFSEQSLWYTWNHGLGEICNAQFRGLGQFEALPKENKLPRRCYPLSSMLPRLGCGATMWIFQMP